VYRKKPQFQLDNLRCLVRRNGHVRVKVLIIILYMNFGGIAKSLILVLMIFFMRSPRVYERRDKRIR
jgi:hypothetical protein